MMVAMMMVTMMVVRCRHGGARAEEHQNGNDTE
jgi:hypothetical protein